MQRVIRVAGGAVLAFMLATGASAQGFELGLRAGFGASSLGGSDVGNVDGADLATGGAFLTWQAARHLALQPELLFKNMAATARVAGDSAANFQVQRLELPLLVKALAPIGSRLEANAFAGPALALETGCLYSGSDPMVTTGGTVSNVGCSDGSPVKTWEWSGVVGAGAEVKLQDLRLLADARYDYGFSSIDGTGLGRSVESRLLSFTLGAAIPIGRTRTTAAVAAP